MYVVTFYSFKGGVGRTMALVNIAVGLARQGRRVLVVDFDLEAPGLPSYQVFKDAACGGGIVDYVTSYRATGIAPNVSEFIAECDVDGSKVWLMPAGRHTSRGYTEALNSIDWQDLYEHQEGFLMFEDMKQQWAMFEGGGFDYVLIDSRTGHTDVGGICTRQLPDSVVVMFLPNDQNIAGLVPIVEGIRAENKARTKRIQLQFCASNVPNLDDENGILEGLLRQSKDKLRYSLEDPVTIHNYGSLELLAQSAFVLTHPNSRIAKEYETLRLSIVATNFDDSEGAVVALKRMPKILDQARKQRRLEIRDRLRSDALEILSKHSKEGQIAYLAARLFSEIGDQPEELRALGIAIDSGHEVNRSRLRRAMLNLASESREETINDLREVVSSPTATAFELSPALRLLQQIDKQWLTALEAALQRPDSDFETLLRISDFTMSERDALPLFARRMERSIHSNALSDQERLIAQNQAALAWIGAGEFGHARSLIAARDVAVSEACVEDVFNLAMAQWGETREIPKELFQIVVDKAPSRPKLSLDANFNQCLALALAMGGRSQEALSALEIAKNAIIPGKMIFSCWRYRNVSAEEMGEDLNGMRIKIEAGEPIEPEFFNEVRKQVH